MNALRIKSGSSEDGLFLRNARPSVPGELENRVLRQAVHQNLVSFPSQIPVFEKQSRPDLQHKIVLLYFVRGWTMEDIAKRYGLGRQRMGQILTAWRIRAVREGYVHAIEPEHPLFRRVRLEEVSPRPELPVEAPWQDTKAAGMSLPRAADPAAYIAQADKASELGDAEDRRESNLAEQLHAMVEVLDNQLRLRSGHLDGNVDSCAPLLASARTLCARLEGNLIETQSPVDWQSSAAVSAAKKLFQRFEEHVRVRSALQTQHVLSQSEQTKAGGHRRSGRNARSLPSVAKGQNRNPARASHKVAAGQ